MLSSLPIEASLPRIIAELTMSSIEDLEADALVQGTDVLRDFRASLYT